jgi:hypothetical protein
MIQSLPSAGRQYVSNHLTTDSQECPKSCFELFAAAFGNDRNLRI